MSKGKTYADDAEKMRAHRQSLRERGFKEVKMFLESQHKDLLVRLSTDLGVTYAMAVGYLLECAYDGELPNLSRQNSSGDENDNE